MNNETNQNNNQAPMNTNLNQNVEPTPMNSNLNQNINQAPMDVNLNQNNEQNNPTIQNIDPAYLKQPVKLTEKKKNKMPLIIITIIVLMIIIGLIIHIITNNPQKIFKNVITKAEKTVTNYIDESNIDKSLTDINFKINTDNKELQQFSKYTYGLKSGIDSSTKSMEGKVYMIDGNKEYSAAGYLKNSKLYVLLSTYDKLINLDNEEENEYQKIFEGLEKTKTEDTKYLIKTISSSLKNNLNKDNFSKKTETITVNNKKIKATKNTYIINEKEADRITKAILKDLYNDEKACKILINLTGTTKEQLKQEIDNNSINNNNNENTYINIYTNFFGKIIGYSIEGSEKENISYFKNKCNFNITYKNEFITYYINGIKKGKNLNVNIKQDDKQLATLNFNKFSKDEISFDYSITNTLEINYKGKVTYKKTKKNNEQTSTLNISVNDQKNNYELNLNLNKNQSAKIADIDETQAVKLSDEEMINVIQKFVESLKETPFGYFLDLNKTADYNSPYSQSYSLDNMSAENNMYTAIDAVKIAYAQNPLT